MGKFNPPWASVGGVARSPTTNEQNDGFSCGDADLTLFNRLFQRYDGEIQAVLDEGGITGTEEDDTGLLQAILAIIAAATGGGDTSQYVLFSQAQARLPIFPEVTTNNGIIAVTAPSTGTVRVPASAIILHRGIRTYVTAETDFATSSSKTYHLRWQISAGVGTFVLKDLADTGYNPTSAAETVSAFDSSYDDMLVARILTNSSNVATITPLLNKDRAAYFERKLVNTGIVQAGSPGYGAQSSPIVFEYNFARRPSHIAPWAALGASIVPSNTGIHGISNLINGLSWNRYAVTYGVFTDFSGPVTNLYVDASISVAT